MNETIPAAKSIRFALAMAIAGAGVMTSSFADEALAKDKGCLACHAVGKKVVGPDYAVIAKKYKDDKDAGAKLAASILKGSTGKWGPIPMPPNTKVSEEEAKKLAAWVLSR